MLLYKIAQKQVIKDKHLIELFLGKMCLSKITSQIVYYTSHTLCYYIQLFQLIHNYFILRSI